MHVLSTGLLSQYFCHCCYHCHVWYGCFLSLPSLLLLGLVTYSLLLLESELFQLLLEWLIILLLLRCLLVLHLLLLWYPIVNGILSLLLYLSYHNDNDNNKTNAIPTTMTITMIRALSFLLQSYNDNDKSNTIPTTMTMTMTMIKAQPFFLQRQW